MKKLLIVIVACILLGAGWYLVSPLFIDKEVNEDFPEVKISEEVDVLGEKTETEDKDGQAMPEDLEGFDEPDKEIMEEMPEMPEEEMKPERVLSGDFKDADDFHMSSGNASIYEIEGKNILRFEDFKTTNGPQLVVILSEHPEPKNKEDLYSGEYVELANLKGNIGNQNYELPNGYNLEKVKSVVIYCKPFHVVFGTATLN